MGSSFSSNPTADVPTILGAIRDTKAVAKHHDILERLVDRMSKLFAGVCRANACPYVLHDELCSVYQEGTIAVLGQLRVHKCASCYLH